MKIKEMIIYGRNILNENGIADANIIVKVLIKYMLKINDSEIIIHGEESVDKSVEEEFIKYIDEIVEGKPVQYITNKQEFMGLEFYVNENVLIPQPDTEILVCEVLEICKKYNRNIKILDICTGSGAIAVSIAKNIETATIYASDISKEALEVAKKNAELNNVKVEIINSDMFKNINEKFDIIVSNPPYIKTEVIKELELQVQNEPHLALDGGNDGLDFYRILAKESQEYLEEDGYLCMEIGYDQKDDVMQILEENNYTNIYSKKDLSENDRIVIGKK